MHTIYKHTNTITGKSYIGQTVLGIHRRWKDHIAQANTKYLHGYTSHFRRALRKYGRDVWKHEELEIVHTQEEANEKEILWIAHYDSYYNGYNSTLGGGCAKLDDEAKAKISIANKGRKHSEEVCAAARIRNAGENNPMFGKAQSERAKQAVSNRRRSESDPTIRTWVHTSGLREESITCLALCDKYPELLISKLNAIAKELKNKKGYRIGISHKGWSIEKDKDRDI